MSPIEGNICNNVDEQRKIALRKRKEYFEQSVHKDRIGNLINEGWQIIRTGKSALRLRKAKSSDVLLEDRIWSLFFKLGFRNMNKDRNCKLRFNGYSKQIDVLARDDNNIFVVECKCSDSTEPINVRDALEFFVGKKGEIVEAIQSSWGRDCGRVNMVVIVSSPEGRGIDKEYVDDNRDKNIFLWSKRDIEYIEEIVNQLGKHAKCQLYSVIFAGRKQKNLKKDCLALRSKIAGRTFYSFLISAKELLNYAYVHHRKLTGIVEASQAYQRMLRSGKLREIARFIDDEDGYFPNSIIVNFNQKLVWNKKEGDDNIALGMVTLPGFYGCAWIIDGQHRLYGAALAEKDIVVPVIAFEGMEQSSQANLFVEINEKQKKVESDLLWDLYSDIYKDSTDEKQKNLFLIAETAKKVELSGPLHGFIDIPSILRDRPVKLSLTTICATLLKYSPWENIKHPTDENLTPEYAARIIGSYYSVLKQIWPEDWDRGKDGVLLTNNGFGVFMMLYQDIIKYLIYKDQGDLLQPSKKNEFEEKLKTSFLVPAIEYLKTDDQLSNDIRSKTGRGPQSEYAALLDLKIQEFVGEDYAPARIESSHITPRTAEPPVAAVHLIEEKASRAEGCLRNFVLNKLKMHYGSDKWWKQGLTGGTKKAADDCWRDEVRRKPHLQRESNINDMKFEFLGLGHMIEIITMHQNWEEIFQSVFIDKDNLQRRIKDVIVLRNPVTHKRTKDDQDVVDGVSGLLWLSKCLCDRNLNPYA